LAYGQTRCLFSKEEVKNSAQNKYLEAFGPKKLQSRDKENRDLTTTREIGARKISLALRKSLR